MNSQKKTLRISRKNLISELSKLVDAKKKYFFNKASYNKFYDVIHYSKTSTKNLELLRTELLLLNKNNKNYTYSKFKKAISKDNEEKALEEEAKKIPSAYSNKVTISKEINSNYEFITHMIELRKAQQLVKYGLYIQTLKFYNKNNDEIISDDKESIFYKPYIQISKKIKDKKISDKLSFAFNASEYRWMVNYWVFGDKEDSIDGKGVCGAIGNYCVIETKAYYKINNNKLYDTLKRLTQIFRDNETNTCVYDGCVKYFENKPKNRNAISILKKLKDNKDLYAKPYKVEELNELATICNASITITNLINKKDDIIINKNTFNRFSLEFVNTRYNHVEISMHSYNDIKILNNDDYYKIKNTLNFYVEKYGNIYALDQVYKQEDSEFKIIFNEWKNQYNINRYFINSNSPEYEFISNYDYSMHRFFNKFEVNNNLYQEYDLKKAYYNYSDINYNKFYCGVPSGSFTNYKITDNFDNEKFIKSYNNKLVGFFEIKIISYKSHHNYFEKLGFLIGSNHILFSAMIKYLFDYIEFEFINISICPSIHIPFNEKFLKKDNKNNLSYYAKATGILMTTEDTIETTIKPQNNDTEYFNLIIKDNENIYKTDDGLIKIEDNNDNAKNYLHIVYAIHSYTQLLILDEILKHSVDSVFGVKLDSIVFKKDIKLEETTQFKIKDANIEGLIKKSNYTNYKSDLDFGTDVIVDEIDNGYYNYYKLENIPTTIFKESFTQQKEILLNRIIFISGKGGSDKTNSILNGGNINLNNTVFSSSCWELIQRQTLKYNFIIGASINKLIGDKCDKINDTNIKNIILDEASLLNKNNVEYIINNYFWCNIIIIGDINYDGFYFQCKNYMYNIINPSEINCHFIQYTKNYRFDNILNNRIDLLREFMFNNKNNIKELKQYILKNWSDRLFKKDDINYLDNDIGISSNNDTGIHSKKLSEYFINKGAKERYYISKTDLIKNEYKGRLTTKENKNSEMTLFKSIYSFQGSDLNFNQRIIISLDTLFDFNLFYTAVSRARTQDQIFIINFKF